MNKTTTTTLLFAAIGACALMLPWGEFGGVPFEDVAEQRLHARLAEYQQMRLDENWDELYDLVDPKHRELVDHRTFVGLYGTGVVKYHTFDMTGLSIDTEERKASVKMSTDGELIPERLPAKFRRGLRVDDPSALRQQGEFILDWRWTDGKWFFALDNAALTLEDEEGRKVDQLKKPVTPPGGASRTK